MYRKGQSSKFVVKSAKDVDITERIFIGTIGINCSDLTEGMVKSIDTTAKDIAFMYVDNGSNEEEVEKLKKLLSDGIPDSLKADCVFAEWNDNNAGVARGWNVIFRQALEWEATRILICNNDLVFHSKTIDNLCIAFDRLKKEHPETVMVTASNVTRDVKVLERFVPEWKYAECPDFSCMMIEPDFFEKVGEYDECFMPAYFEDNACHARILLQGYRAYGVSFAPYCHFGGVTRDRNPGVVSHDKFKENREQFWRMFEANSPDQKLSDDKYKLWIADHPEDIHPKWQDVIAYWVEKNGSLFDPANTLKIVAKD